MVGFRSVTDKDSRLLDFRFNTDNAIVGISLSSLNLIFLMDKMKWELTVFLPALTIFEIMKALLAYVFE